VAITRGSDRTLESSIARVLTIGTYASVGLIALGVLGMAAGGVDPLAAAPAFDPTKIPGDLAALRPAGFLWLGILGVLATPASRVGASLVGYLRTGERVMVGVSVAILVVIAAGVVTGFTAA
jgi:uncharacterized membrane protein